MQKQTYFNARTVATVAMFSALAFGVGLLEFPIFPATPYFKLDFSFSVLLIAAFCLGPIAGEITAAVSIALHLFVSSSGGAGELCNFILTQFFVVAPSAAYALRRKFSTVAIAMPVATVITSLFALVNNRYIIFPIYMGGGAASEFRKVWGFALAFNIIKCVANTAVTLILYKRLSVLLHKYVLVGYNRRMEYVTSSAKETIGIAKKFGKTLKGGDVVLLEGEMGAGKTVFAKGVALALGIKDEITSPTYAYMNDYYGKLYHYDCYRLSGGEDADALGLTDYFYGNGVCLVEWSENIRDVLPENCKRVKIEKLGDTKRRITFL